MKHFADEDWVDFARQVVSPADMEAMQGHLDKGCVRCQAACDLWTLVAATAQRDAEIRVPAELQHLVEAEFAVTSPVIERSGALQMAQLMFDSVLQPAAAGVRSQGASCRQMLYQSGNCCVDLRIEARPDKKEISLIGQIQDATAFESMSAVPISLVEGRRVVVATETNAMGEFHMEFQSRSKLSLSIGLQNKTLVMPLSITPQESE